MDKQELAELKKKCAKALFDAKLPISGREVGEAIKMSHAEHKVYEALKEMRMYDHTVEKVDFKFTISDYGKEFYDLVKVKSALKQTEKTPVEPPQPEPEPEKSALEQILETEIRFRDPNPAHFVLWKKIEDLGKEIIEEIIDKQPQKKIDMAEHKAEVLLRIADSGIMNSGYSTLLTEIAQDLKQWV